MLPIATPYGPAAPRARAEAVIAAAGPHVRAALLAAFAASGCAALVYEVVWFQLLSLSIGASAISLGVLLAAFLGGMGVGSVLLPRLVPAGKNALLVYAWLEIGTAALGWAAPHAIGALGGLYTAWAGTGTASLVLRALVAAACVLPPTVLMGATLPAIARALDDGTPRGASWLGLVYSSNVAGGVLGSVLAGFWLLRDYDVRTATLAAVALNLLAAAAALLASRTAELGMNGGRAERRAATTTFARPVDGTIAPMPILMVAALSGATALSAEVLWTRHLALLLGGTVYTFALIVAVFLAGLALGGGAGAAIARRANPAAALAACQLLLCGAIAWAAYAVGRSLPFWPLDVTLPTTPRVALELDLVRIAFAVLPATLLWGASFTLVLACASRGARHAGDDRRRIVGAAYAANTAGAIAGSLLTSLVLVAAIGSRRTEQILIVAAACSALIALLGDRAPGGVPNMRTTSLEWSRRHFARPVAAAAALVASALLATAIPAVPPQLVAYGRFLPTRGVDANVVYVGEGVSSSIAVTREPSGILTYHNAGKTQASTYPQDLRLERMLGHLATLVPEKPSSVLVIGLGAGITAGAVSIDPAVEHVTVAEIEPLVRGVAARFFAEHNFDVTENPKVELRVDDGRHYLATTRERFDAITSDPLDPWVKGAAALYTREFWALCKSRLNPGGVVTVFLQLYETSEDAVKSELATFFEAFPNGVLFANTVEGAGYDAVLLGRLDDAPIDVERIARRLGRADYEPVARSLREVGIGSAVDLLGRFAARAPDLARWLDGAAINADASLKLQYLAGASVNSYRSSAIFASLVGDGPRYPEGLFVGTPAEIEALRQRLATGARD